MILQKGQTTYVQNTKKEEKLSKLEYEHRKEYLMKLISNRLSEVPKSNQKPGLKMTIFFDRKKGQVFYFYSGRFMQTKSVPNSTGVCGSFCLINHPMDCSFREALDAVNSLYANEDFSTKYSILVDSNKIEIIKI